jgi:hypothetical protein
MAGSRETMMYKAFKIEEVVESPTKTRFTVRAKKSLFRWVYLWTFDTLAEAEAHIKHEAQYPYTKNEWRYYSDGRPDYMNSCW